MNDHVEDCFQANTDCSKFTVSIVILTYNREGPLKKLLSHLAKLNNDSVEVIVVDNNSYPPLEDIQGIYPFVKVISLKENIGIAGRNIGIEKATAPIVITLDDDIIGINNQDINYLYKVFNDKSIGAVTFKSLYENSNVIVDWCHHNKMEDFHNQSFDTAEITEGAVAFRKDIAMDAGLYPVEYFLSHEGPDLSIRIINLGYRVIYDPNIIVRHSRSPLGRLSWRRYYYDTRNLIWLVIRVYPIFSGLRRLSIGIIALAIYSLRDGFFKYWIKGVYDGIKGMGWALKNRITLTDDALNMLDTIDKNRPSLLYMIKLRIFKKKFGF